MKRILIFLSALYLGMMAHAGMVDHVFYFSNVQVGSNGPYHTVSFENTLLCGIPGEPLMPWHEVALMVPPGETAISIELIEEDETAIPGSFLLYPKQPVRPLSADEPGEFVKNEKVYLQTDVYPRQRTGQLLTQRLNGYTLALCTFTPVKYIPGKRTISYFKKVTVRIITAADAPSRNALSNLPLAGSVLNRVKSFVMNPEMMNRYPQREAPAINYEYLIISPVAFKNEFQPLITMHSGMGISVRVVATDSISATMTGFDMQEKIRNFIINQYQNHSIQYVLLAGNPALIPSRGFYCFVQSGSTPYTDSNIPADLYYSGLDGNYDANGNHIYAEIADNADLLPEVAVARFTVNDTAELRRMIRKTVGYQTNPVLGEFSKPLLAGEYLYNNPVTFGGDYMDLFIDDHNDNGYFTHGIPSATNQIVTLYDSLIAPPLTMWQWSASMLLARINQGNSFIHHLGHASTTYMMRLQMSAITNANFSQVNGITHNYQFLYTQGCYDGAFDIGGGCIAAKAVTIDNFLVAGVFNSRYGWFNQGTTDGPSQHLEREFVSALYTDTLPEKHLGAAHMISKIKTAPWVSLPGEFEPGAQRWCHYCCNVFGDPALEIRTEEPTSFTNITWTGNIDSDWNNPGNWNLNLVPTSLYDVTIPNTTNNPVITTVNKAFCHNLNILNGGNLAINPDKSMVVYGTVTIVGE